jgi:hypothetical protein
MKKVALAKFDRLKGLQSLTPFLVVALLLLSGAVIYNWGARAATGFAFESSSSSYKVGETLSVNVIVDSGSQCANVVQADFSYPADLLEYKSVSASGSKYESTAPGATNGNGNISIIQYTTRKECGSGASATSGVSGQQLVATVSFTVIKAGTASLTFKSSSQAISASDNQTNVAPGYTNSNYTLTAASTNPNPTPTPGPSPTPQPPATPNPVPVTSITPRGSSVSVPVNNNEVVEVTTPIDVQPLPIQPDGVNRIEYYLDDKLVATVKTPPYKYSLDTTALLNGTYRLTTKTYYNNGQTKQVSQTIVVKNAFGWTQLKLRLQKLAWLIILVTVLLIAAVTAWVLHNRGSGGGGGKHYDFREYDDDTDTSGSSDGDGGSDDSNVITPDKG